MSNQSRIYPLTGKLPAILAAFSLAIIAGPASASLIAFGDFVIFDGDENDLDPTVNNILLDGFTPPNLPDVRVRDLALRFNTAPGEVGLTSTSSTVAPGASWNIGVVPGAMVDVFTVEFAVPVPPLSQWGFPDTLPPGMVPIEVTTHLNGYYTFESIVEMGEMPTSHASASFHAQVFTSQGPVSFPALTGYAENFAPFYPVGPPDRTDVFMAGEDDIFMLMGRLTLDLGPGAGFDMPVSAEVTMRIIPEPAATAGFLALAALIVVAAARRHRNRRADRV